ncbi:phage tail protein [Burkholderia gladioli]|uniref:phage tail protein n=1 Tax=Burkholderia gladioli TaxID=28095 RepID=UPI001FC7D7E4|nr:phage tail protein [Burkholderia gladioli]
MIDLKERAGIAMSVRGQFTEPIADPKVTLGALAFANDLGRMLVRIKAAQQAKPETIRRATLLLAQMMRTSGRFKRGKFSGLKRDERREQRAGGVVERVQVDVIERFALRLIDEWVSKLRAIGSRMKPVRLTTGSGDVLGRWLLQTIEEEQDAMLADGLPRKQSFTVEFGRYGEDFKNV